MAHAEYRLTLPPRTDTDDDLSVAAVLAKAKAEIGMIPNMYANMANAPALLNTYLLGYSAFRAESGLSATEQETVLLTISRFNGCGYCMAAHSAVADMTHVPAAITDAIRDGQPIPDHRVAALADFTLAMLTSRGMPSTAAVEAFLDAGYTEQHVLHIILAIAVKTISNYSNHLFHTPVDAAFAARTWEG
ncbi:MAG: carboxymuconolactone decarboxylase family protein [Actinobacteria bacterium]|nr:carboxymuconolactone decarboxylase family protein [Actinomycetota bacterium]